MNKQYPTCALNIGLHYLDKKLFALSFMTVAKNATGQHIWVNTGVFAKSPDLSTVLKSARAIANKLQILQLRDVKKGDSISKVQMAELELYGLLDHLK